MPFANSLWGTKLYTEVARIDPENNSELLPIERRTEIANSNKKDVWNTATDTDVLFSNFISNNAKVYPIDINKLLAYNGGLFFPFKNRTSTISYAGLYIIKEHIDESLANLNFSNTTVLFGFLEPLDGSVNNYSNESTVALLYWKDSWYLAHTGAYPIYGIKYFIK